MCGAKASPAVVDPDAVRRLEIIAHVNVRRAVAVDVAQQHRETEIHRLLFEWLAVLVEKRSTGPRQRGELSLAVIEIHRARFAKLDDAAVDNFPPSRVSPADHWLAIDGANAQVAATPQNGGFAIVCDEQIKRAVAIEITERERCTAQRTHGNSRSSGRVGKTPIALVEEERRSAIVRGDQQIEPTIAVHVGENGTRGKEF